jgi:diacylglycerol O-acyltransferase
MAGIRRLQMSAGDASWDYAERFSAAGSTQSGFVYTFDADSGAFPMSVEQVAQWLADRLPGVPLLTRSLRRVPLDLEHPYWQDVDDFDPSMHVTVQSAAGAGWDGFHRTLVEVLQRPLDQTRPMWDLHVITDVRDVEGFPRHAVAVVVRIHHAVADGLSEVSVGRALFSPTPSEPAAREPIEAPSVRVAALRGIARFPVDLIRYLWRLAQLWRLWRSSGEDAVRGRRLYPRTRFNQPLLGRPSVACVRFDLREVRAVGRALGPYSVNDVLLTVVAGALRSYLAGVGELPVDTLVATVPKSLRTAQDPIGGNVGVSMEVALHTDVADPIARLRAVKSSVDAEKQWATGPAAAAQQAVTTAVPASLLSRVTRPSSETPTEPWPLDQPRKGENTLVTNIPVGAPDLFFGAAPVRDAFRVNFIRPGQGLTHVLNSLGDRVSITVTVDDYAMPDVEHYVELLHSSYEELARAAGLRRT